LFFSAVDFNDEKVDSQPSSTLPLLYCNIESDVASNDFTLENWPCTYLTVRD